MFVAETESSNVRYWQQKTWIEGKVGEILAAENMDRRQGSEDSDVDDVLSKLQKNLKKKKKNGSRRIQKKDRKEKEPVCYECRKPVHLRPDCPKLKKIG
ncbi:hypothetical protein Taro_027400 [Colocasia esculenta]|uniref:CCHC-type domain-containing protein n=1 Tax=Colocasia esculenta TaxID=4460 RepID=A0A843V8M2_COLES|nr:hypothetical protein [Colocasia esculenta]